MYEQGGEIYSMCVLHELNLNLNYSMKRGRIGDDAATSEKLK